MKRGTIALLVVLGIAMYIGYFWEQLDPVRNAVNYVLDPTFGRLIEFNLYFGFVVIVGVLSLAITLAQKYLTNQVALKKLREKQKGIQKTLKAEKDPKRQMEIQKEMWQLTFHEQIPLTMRSSIFIAIPIVLFFRWFSAILTPVWGGWWFLWYMLATLVFSNIFRKSMKVY